MKLANITVINKNLYPNLSHINFNILSKVSSRFEDFKALINSFKTELNFRYDIS